MFLHFLRFELIYIFRKPAVYIFALIFFLMAYGPIVSDSMQMGGSIGNAARNSPYEIVRLLAMLSVLGLFSLVGFVATAVNRDDEYRTTEFFYTTPVGKGSYLMGRFAGSMVAAVFTVAVAALGIVVGSQMPWLDPERILPFSAAPYLFGLFVYVIPNMLFAGAMMFCVSTLSRRVVLGYISVMGLLTLWGIGKVLTGNLDSAFLAVILDPLGKASLDMATRYWTVVERNTLLPPFDAGLIVNRLLWSGLGVGFLLLTWSRFRMAVHEKAGAVRRFGRRRRVAHGALADPSVATSKKPVGAVGADAAVGEPLALAAPEVTLGFSTRAQLSQLWYATRVEVRSILKSIPFVIIIGFAVFNLLGSLVPEFEGTKSYPLTRSMISTIEGSYTIFLFIFLIVYAGILVWRERLASMNEITGALPTPDWMPMASKLAALTVVQFVALCAAVATTILYQLSRGYLDLELGLYFRGIFLLQMSAWFLVSALALALQALTNSRLAGYGAMIAFFVIQEVIGSVGFEHNLLLYGETPAYRLSDMNGFGHFARPLSWFLLYWGFAAGLLVLASVLFWPRGTDLRPGLRWREARRRLTGPRVATAVVLLLGFVGVGGWIHYNTSVLNDFVTSKTLNERAARYEQLYKKHDGIPQPRVTDVSLEVDIYPGERRVDVHGDLVLMNKSDEAISEVHLTRDWRLDISEIALAGASCELEDRELCFSIYQLPRPLEPGESLELAYTGSITNPGFVNGHSNKRVVENGTFLDSSHLVPFIGYASEQELENEHDRRKYGLDERPGLLSPDHPVAVENTFTMDADWINYEAVLSTSADQIAMTAGYVEREWEEDGRRYFHYRMDTPILHFFPVVSGRYEVASETWNDVEIAVYHHAPHMWNVDRMLDSVKRSLDYYTEVYGPYQHHELRIVEFPRYHTFAQSFATIIPYSEGIHFTDDLREEGALDMVSLVTAHEVAHQWWGHQVAAALAQGMGFVEESLAQYSAFMVTEQYADDGVMEEYLRYELDRYLQGRGQERDEEHPLALVDKQSYLYYFKGSLAMYAFKEYLGEDVLNTALRAYLEDTRFVGPPYPVSLDLVEYIRDVTPPEYAYLIEDYLETITLYDNRMEGVEVEELDDGRYRVALDLMSRKMRADGRGVETEIEHNDWVEIGVYGDDGESGTPIYLERHRLASGENRIEVVVEERPVRAGIDPRHLLIDRVPDDNLKRA